MNIEDFELLLPAIPEDYEKISTGGTWFPKFLKYFNINYEVKNNEK